MNLSFESGTGHCQFKEHKDKGQSPHSEPSVWKPNTLPTVLCQWFRNGEGENREFKRYEVHTCQLEVLSSLFSYLYCNVRIPACPEATWPLCPGPSGSDVGRVPSAKSCLGPSQLNSLLKQNQ